jgi:hypothetical protein
MPLPEYGKWRLNHPLLDTNPPFPILEVDLVNKTGSALLNMNSYPLLTMTVRPGAGVFLARYKVGSHHGLLEATYQSDKSLSVEFMGTVETTCTGSVIATRGLIDGPPDAPQPEPTQELEPSKYQIHCAGDIARWFDGLVVENERGLKRWCEQVARENPDSWVAVGLAHSAKDLYSAAAHMAQGTVDTLRLGEGFAEGGWGIGKDFLRALAFMPMFKAVKPVAGRIATLRRSSEVLAGAEAAGAETSAARTAASTAARRAPSLPPTPRPAAIPPRPAPLPRWNQAPTFGGKLPVPPAPNVPGGNCTWITMANGLRLYASKIHVTAETLWKEAGCLKGGAVNLENLAGFVRNTFGVILKPVSGFRKLASSAEEIVDVVKARPVGSVVLFEVEYGKGAHTMMAWNSPEGVYIVDRTIEQTGKLVKSLAELEGMFPNSGYTGLSKGVLRTAFQMENCTAGFLAQQGGALKFAIGITISLTVNALRPNTSKN